MKAQARNVRIDILRIVSMMFIIILHMVNQGGLLNSCTQYSGQYYYLSFLNIIAYCAVNIYGLITGCVMCNKTFSLSRLLNLWLTTAFWSCVISIVFLLFSRHEIGLFDTVFSLYYRVVVFSAPLQGHMLHCKGCCGSVCFSYRKTVQERLQPQPFTVLLIS